MSPRNSKLFFLRLLLHNRPDAAFYEDLITVDGELIPSNRAACIAQWLLEEDHEWHRALKDDCKWGLEPLAYVLAYILAHCVPSDPKTLFEKHKQLFSDDIHNRHRGCTKALRRL